MSYDTIEIPDSITPIIGYRGWIFKDGFLYSCYRSVKWPLGKALKAECIHPTFASLNEKNNKKSKIESNHYFPTKDCSCGIYALHEFPNASEKDEDGVRRRASKPWPHYALSGVVIGWGHVVMGEKGFRAEFAQPLALISRPRSKTLTPIIEELAFNYDIDIVSYKEIKKNGYWKA